MADLFQCSLEIILPVHDFYHPSFYLDDIGTKVRFGALEPLGGGVTKLPHSVVEEAVIVLKVVVFAIKVFIFGLKSFAPIPQPVVSGLIFFFGIVETRSSYITW